MVDFERTFLPELILVQSFQAVVLQENEWWAGKNVSGKN
jgi:hypothetical protein